jgi:glucosamine 6-phosphate synthetase-like amidotransferase/phosphosugar isomerase protein
MCGIIAFYARESVPDLKVLDMLFENSENRGTDGFGVWIGRKDNFKIYKSVNKYTLVRKEIMQFVKENLKIGNLLLAISRAAPETESQTTLVNMQPIINSDCVLIHNGSVTPHCCKELSDKGFKFNTDIDSEAIIGSYLLHNKNIKNAMEYIAGGIAAVMYDTKQDMLYTVTDFHPLAHGYIRGIGYFLSSDNDAIGQAIKMITGITRDGVNVWENFYHHYLPGNFIRTTDLDSGMQREIRYSPRYIVGDIWDSSIKKEIAL